MRVIKISNYIKYKFEIYRLKYYKFKKGNLKILDRVKKEKRVLHVHSYSSDLYLIFIIDKIVNEHED